MSDASDPPRPPSSPASSANPNPADDLNHTTIFSGQDDGAIPTVQSRAGSMPGQATPAAERTMRMPVDQVAQVSRPTDWEPAAPVSPPPRSPRRNIGGIIAIVLAVAVVAGGVGAVVVAQNRSATEAGEVTTTTNDPNTSTSARSTTTTTTVDPGAPLVAMPDVVGLERDAAITILEDLGLMILVEDDAESFRPEGRVTHQSVAVGESVAEGSTVTLDVSTGTAEPVIPYTIGMTEADARAELAEAGFEDVEVIVIPDAETPAGQVIRSQPDPGDEHNPERTVRLFLASDTGIKSVPSVVGVNLAAATLALEQLGFTVEVQTAPASGDTLPGTVLNQDPAEGESRPAGSTIVVVVADGEPTDDTADQ